MKLFFKIILGAAVIVGAFFVVDITSGRGGPIFPKSYPQACISKDMSERMTMDQKCDSNQDCIDWAAQNCGPENTCNNIRIECHKQKCVEVEYYRFNKTCV